MRIFGLLLLLSVGGCADQWLLYPSTEPRDAAGAEQRQFNLDGRKIDVFVARSPGVKTGEQPVAYSLEFGGNSMRAEDFATDSAQMWGSRSVEVWAMNYPSFGASDGPASLQLIPKSALATYDQLKQQAHGRPIFVKGFSMGTTAALCVAARRPVVGVILRSPPPLQRQIMWKYGWWNLWMVASITALEIPGELNSLTNGPNAKAPAVFLISGQDTLVPPEYQKMVFDSYAGPKRCLVRDADHNTPIPTDDLAVQRELD